LWPARATTEKGAPPVLLSTANDEYQSGSISVQTAANQNFFHITSSSSGSFAEMLRNVRHSELYQQLAVALVKGKQSDDVLSIVGRVLVEAAEHAYGLRWMSVVEKVSKLLLTLPNPYHSIGNYYHALYIKRSGNLDEARLLFESIADHGPARGRARAIASAAGVAFESGALHAALSLFVDACRAAASQALWDPLASVTALHMIGVVKSIDGDHQGALVHLDRMFPLVRSIALRRPQLLYTYLNSLAVELMEVGRLDEADIASRRALASPYGQAYPEWQETGRDISLKRRRRSRSVVAVGSPIIGSEEQEKTPNSTPTVYAAAEAQPEGSSSILIFPDRTQRASSEVTTPSRLKAEQLAKMTFSQKRDLLLTRAQNMDIPEEVYDRLLLAADVPDHEQLSREIDLESPGILEEMTTLWINGGIAPDDLAAVLSAIRDCDDALRRTNILDRMISYAFRESRQGLDSEELWRKRFEARLEPADSEPPVA
jgi:tetratricopeptide (TPR) repeat protein